MTKPHCTTCLGSGYIPFNDGSRNERYGTRTIPCPKCYPETSIVEHHDEENILDFGGQFRGDDGRPADDHAPRI